MEGMWKQTAQFLPVWFLIMSLGGVETVNGQLEPENVGVVNNSLTAVQPGGAVKLACPIPAEMFGTRVSWIRKKDVQLLAVGEVMYTKDNRLFVSHSGNPQAEEAPKHPQVWFLHLKNVTMDDEGEYECQTSTHPHVSFYTFLKVQMAYSSIQGPKERVVAAGSDLQLICDIIDSTSPPAYVFWYQDAKMVNYDATRGIHVSSGPSNHSILKVSRASEEHAGNYTCAPANTDPSSVLVHVIPETNESGGNSDQKRGAKTPVRQLGVKSPSSAGCRDLPHHLQLFLFGLLLFTMPSFVLFLPVFQK